MSKRNGFRCPAQLALAAALAVVGFASVPSPADAGYYWVPGVWVQPPSVGLLWTPAWWGWENGAYLFHAGYWGPHVGFYGGINYGFGYGGVGFFGGEWRGGAFFYNRTVANVNVTNVTRA